MADCSYMATPWQIMLKKKENLGCVWIGIYTPFVAPQYLYTEEKWWVGVQYGLKWKYEHLKTE